MRRPVVVPRSPPPAVTRCWTLMGLIGSGLRLLAVTCPRRSSRSLAYRERLCCFRWCGRQLCLRNMPISGVNLTPRPTAVYASDPALPRRPQDSLPSCLLGFERTRLALASSYQLPIAPRTRLLSKVKHDRRSGLGRPIQVRSVGAGRRGHADSGAVSGACVGPCPSFNPSLHALRPRPVGRCCSRLHRYYAAHLVRNPGMVSNETIYGVSRIP